MNSDWLVRALEESRARGYLGPGAIESQIRHAEGFAACWEERAEEPPEAFLDLGSGGGLPGLVLLDRWHCRGSLVDSMQKRTKFLREVLTWPDAPTSGEVYTGRSEELARTPELEGTFDLVTARSFGPPAVTAECAARFLKIGGLLIVSEPPVDQDVTRWNVEKLAVLGLEPLAWVRHGAAFEVLTKRHATPPQFPRGIGVPAKNPLF
ncbi:MAG TPA: RsmG family class I SAM-dependent methyltransferase [Acidimicrobiales bacterium]|nr:RsmG family class I SAM-dependent methyltransferase [Acidimicrobiales bacterium]